MKRPGSTHSLHHGCRCTPHGSQIAPAHHRARRTPVSNSGHASRIRPAIQRGTRVSLQVYKLYEHLEKDQQQQSTALAVSVSPAYIHILTESSPPKYHVCPSRRPLYPRVRRPRHRPRRTRRVQHRLPAMLQRRCGCTFKFPLPLPHSCIGADDVILLYVQSQSSQGNKILSLVGVAVEGVTGLVGVGCTPITAVVGVSISKSCNAHPVCCSDSSAVSVFPPCFFCVMVTDAIV